MSFRHREPCLVAAILGAILGCGSNSGSAAPAIDAAGACVGNTAALLSCVEQARISADIEAMSIERVPGSLGWQSAQDLCKSRLEEFGYQVALKSYATGTNVIGRKAGVDIESGDVIVSAHYDHIAGCPGADDNASGMAATLEIARLLAVGEHRRSLVIACWDEEELGLIGSSAYADAAFEGAALVTAMFSMEAVGYASSEPNSQTIPPGFELLFPDQVAEVEARDFRGDYITLVGDVRSAAVSASFEIHAESVGLETLLLPVPEQFKLIPATSDLRRSDHASFWVHDYPGIMVTDSANFRNPNYHCGGGMDLPSTLDMSFATQVTQATLGAAFDALNSP